MSLSIARKESFISGTVLRLGSGTSSAAANVAAIQAALDSYNQVTIDGDGIYYYNSTLVQPSNSRLIIGPGVEMRLTGGTKYPFVTNSARLDTPQAVTSLTSSGSVVTLTCTGHGYSVGNYISVGWAAESGYNGVFKVVSTPTADTLTYYSELIPEATTATVSTSVTDFNPSEIQVRLANNNIELVNYGIINTDNGTNTGATANGLDLMCVIYGHVNNLKTSGNGIIKDTSKYGIYAYAVRDYTVDGCYFDTDSDGVHITGPIHNFIGRNIAGQCGDNMMAIGTGDYAAYHVSEGDVFMRASDIGDVNMGIQPVRFFGSDKFKIFATIDGVSGRMNNQSAVQLLVDALVLPNGNVRATDIKIKRVVANTGTAAVVAVVPHSAVSVDVDDITMLGTGNGVSIGGSSAYTYQNVRVSKIVMPDATNGASAKCVVTGSAVVIENLTIDNPVMVHNQVTTGRMVELDGTVKRLTINNPRCYQGSALVNILSTVDAVCDISIVNPEIYDTNYIINNSSTLNVTAAIVGGIVDSTNTVFRHAGASGTLACRTAGTILKNNTNIIGRTSTQAVEAYGWEIGVDVDILATTDGQFCRNTDATSTAGIAAGLARYEGGWALI